MRAVNPIEVEGLPQLQKALRQIDKALPREIRVINLDAAKIVAAAAARRARGLGGVARKSAPSIKAKAQQRRGTIAIGGPKFPFAPGAEFGSIRYNQFKAWRGNQFTQRTAAFEDHTTGYFLYPSIRAERVAVRESYVDALEALLRKNGMIT